MNIWTKDKITGSINKIVVPDDGIPGFIRDNFEVFETDPGIEPELTLEEWKVIKYAEILTAFNKQLADGVFKSTALDINVDCRRNLTKNDLQNVQGLLSYMTRNSLTEISYVGYTQTVPATLAQLTDLSYEMEDFVMGLYEKKHNLEDQTAAAKDTKELFNILW